MIHKFLNNLEQGVALTGRNTTGPRAVLLWSYNLTGGGMTSSYGRRR